MNAKVTAILGVFALAAFLGIAFFAYQYISNRVAAPDNLRAPENIVAEAGESVPVPDAETTEVPENQTYKAIDFTMTDMDGTETKLADSFGKPIVLNFWASWCPPCKSEMPEFNKVYTELGETVQFMMVDLVDGQQETVETGAAYIAEQGFTFPVYFDTLGEGGTFYGIRSIPTTIFIDAEGSIVTGVEGAIDEETLRRGIAMITENQEDVYGFYQ
ncbi:MAG: redoxin domain-containing protein [Clostridiales bacterium]|jgi:thiol-disulfide isomerase/thioredoxin|nr:redoxin domain-containing protein [Clostridiales bacterium]